MAAKAGSVSIDLDAKVAKLTKDLNTASKRVEKSSRRMKKSFGTAMKLIGHGWWSNISVYAKLALFTAIILWEPQMPEMPSQLDDPAAIQQTAERLIDRVLRR